MQINNIPYGDHGQYFRVGYWEMQDYVSKYVDPVSRRTDYNIRAALNTPALYTGESRFKSHPETWKPFSCLASAAPVPTKKI
jgi:hypothetical protein